MPVIVLTTGNMGSKARLAQVSTLQPDVSRPSLQHSYRSHLPSPCISPRFCSSGRFYPRPTLWSDGRAVWRTQANSRNLRCLYLPRCTAWICCFLPNLLTFIARKILLRRGNHCAASNLIDTSWMYSRIWSINFLLKLLIIWSYYEESRAPHPFYNNWFAYEALALPLHKYG